MAWQAGQHDCWASDNFAERNYSLAHKGIVRNNQSVDEKMTIMQLSELRYPAAGYAATITLSPPERMKSVHDGPMKTNPKPVRSAAQVMEIPEMAW